jgi:hypothetical protein
MRLRHVLFLAPLAILPVAIALIVGRSHPKSPAAPGAVPALVGLNLKGGVAETLASACGVPHHYTVYRGGGAIRFDGTVNSPPRATWRVKVKLKSCVDGAFQDSGAARVHRRADNTYKGAFRAPVPGHYFARAAVNVGGRRVARSSKQFFEVR